MDVESLVDQTFSENEFYELLLFEIEENFEQFFFKFMHFYFDRTEDKNIKITEVVFFMDDSEMDKKARTIIEKKEWFHIYENHGHIDLMLVRFDRTGKVSIVRKNETRTEDWSLGWADETPHKPMTQDEIRRAVQEMVGLFEDQQELQKLGPKKAV